MKKVIMTDEEQQFSDLKQLFNKIITKNKNPDRPPPRVRRRRQREEESQAPSRRRGSQDWDGGHRADEAACYRASMPPLPSTLLSIITETVAMMFLSCAAHTSACQRAAHTALGLPQVPVGRQHSC